MYTAFKQKAKCVREKRYDISTGLISRSLLDFSFTFSFKFGSRPPSPSKVDPFIQLLDKCVKLAISKIKGGKDERLKARRWGKNREEDLQGS